jgi:hypothetical protein
MGRTFVAGLAVATLLVPVAADARITRLEFARVESPTFDGVSFGDRGPFEKLVGRPGARSTPTIRTTPSSRTSSWRRAMRMAWSSIRPTSTSSSPWT